MLSRDRLCTPREIIQYLDLHVAGQQRAKRDLATAVYRHYLGLAVRDHPGQGGFGPQHVLMFGPTGSGKTHLVRTLARWLDVPVAFCAATSLVEAGYVGEQVESCLLSLLSVAGGDPKKAERGIVYLDEFDKVRRAEGVTRDVSGEGVQNGLLSLFDGTRSRFRVRDMDFKLDTSRVLFLCTGAFSGLPEVVRRRRAKRTGLGFGARIRDAHSLTDAQAMESVTGEDLIDYGFIPELVNRFNTLTSVHALEMPEMLHILGGVEDSVLRRLGRQCELHRVRLDVPEDARRSLAERALASGGGARALARLANDAFSPVAWRLPELQGERIGTVRLTAAAVAGDAEPELLPLLPDEIAPEGFAGVDLLRTLAMGGRPTVKSAEPRENASKPTVRAAAKSAGDEGLDEVPEQELAGRMQVAKLALDWQRMRGENLLGWVEFERSRSPRAVLWVLETLRNRAIPVTAFTLALRTAGTAHPPALMHYAAYLHDHARYELSQKRRRPRSPKPPAKPGEDEPVLDV